MVKRYGRQISLSESWKFRTDPDGMGDRYPDDAVAAHKEDCKFFDPAYDTGTGARSRCPRAGRQKGTITTAPPGTGCASTTAPMRRRTWRA